MSYSSRIDFIDQRDFDRQEGDDQTERSLVSVVERQLFDVLDDDDPYLVQCR